MTRAWMIRNDGKSIPVVTHLYAMQDDDFSSEAEVASFLLKYAKQDHELSKYVLDVWMAKLVEAYLEDIGSGADIDYDIESILKYQLKHLPYRIMFPLSDMQYIGIHNNLRNFWDIYSLEDFLNTVEISKENIWKDISDSLNQQFCRARYGGQYDSARGNSQIWFRISSVGFDWSDVIYSWTAAQKVRLNIQYISICRDMESDYGEFAPDNVEYFYKAKDGSTYFNMPIDEYFSEEHGTSPVFSSKDYNINRGVYYSIRLGLRQGDTFRTVLASTMSDLDIKPRLLSAERRKCYRRVKGLQ